MLRGGFLKKVISSFLLTGTLLATPHNEPWFKPLWEITGRFEYDYFKNSQIVSPNQTFSHNRLDHIFGFGLQTTPWPYWNAEIEIDFDASRPSFYEVTYLTGSYLLLDELACDFLNLSLGLTAYFPNGNFLADPSFLFVGKTNFELFSSFGKEITECWRLWGYSGFGFADRGHPWLHIRAISTFQISCFFADISLKYLHGLGNQDIITITPFPGYANIAYRRLNLESCLTYVVPCLGALTVGFDYNVYAQNSSHHNYVLSLILSIPFSF